MTKTNQILELLDIIDYQAPTATGLAEPGAIFRVKRLAVRAVALDDQGQVHMLKVADEGGYLKLPGGGVEAGEDPLEALDREVQEELGYDIKVISPLGRIVQFDHQESFYQDSHCNLATITGGDGRPSFTQEEIDNGFEATVFPSLDAAIAGTGAHQPTGHEAQSIGRRDLVFFKAARAKLPTKP